MNEEYVSCAACLGSGKVKHMRLNDSLFTRRECKYCNGKGYFKNEHQDPIKPSHYHTGNIDVIKFSEENFEDVENKGFFRGNILKYVTRYDRKNGLEDLMKAEFYLQKLIEMERAKNKRGVSE